MEEVKRGRGRPRLGAEPMSGTERSRRCRQRQREQVRQLAEVFAASKNIQSNETK